MKRMSDNIASYFVGIGIKKDDMVMCILKRRYQFWPLIIALHKIGAVVIPATYLLTDKDIVYRCHEANIKTIVACGDDEIIEHINDAYPECPSVEQRISIGPIVPEGWLELTEDEIYAIRWHMSAWDLSDYRESRDSFGRACDKCPLLSVIIAADELATRITENIGR